MIEELAGELQDYSSIFKAKVLKNGNKDYIHYAIYEMPDGSKNMILVNTSKTESKRYAISEFADFTLEPLGVKIIRF